MVTMIAYCIFLIYSLNLVDANFYGYGLPIYSREYANQNRDSQINSYISDTNENIRYEQNPEWQQRRTAKEVESWPHPDSLQKLGQVNGVATSKDKNVHIFHRADVVWDFSSFNAHNVYNHKDREPIANDTVLVLDPLDGRIIKSWGSKRFFMPHGISIDPQGNIWLTDVALHQVFRFKRDQLNEPDLVLGERFVPGDDSKHFCKPTDIAISSSGVIYISDGYCNSRIVIFSPEGNFIGQFGLTDNLVVPHSITLLELEDLLCVADRENRRVLCYTAGLTGEREAGKLVFNIQHQRLGRVYAIDHIGDIMLALSGGKGDAMPPIGVSLDLATEQLVDVWGPKTHKFEEPHDIAVSSDGTSFYVSEISLTSPKKIYKFNI
jgi:peptidylamidoglycolate lyase